MLHGALPFSPYLPYSLHGEGTGQIPHLWWRCEEGTCFTAFLALLASLGGYCYWSFYVHAPTFPTARITFPLLANRAPSMMSNSRVMIVCPRCTLYGLFVTFTFPKVSPQPTRAPSTNSDTIHSCDQHGNVRHTFRRGRVGVTVHSGMSACAG